jgi:hypothetical protein
MSAWFGMRPCGANLSIAWKHARQLGNQISRRHAGQTRQVVDSLRAERLMQLIRCDRLVLSRSDPRVDDVAVSALLKALQQAAEATKQAPLRCSAVGAGGPGGAGGAAAPLPNKFPNPPPPVARAARSAAAAIMSGLARLPPGTADPRTSSSNPLTVLAPKRGPAHKPVQNIESGCRFASMAGVPIGADWNPTHGIYFARL